MDRSHWLVREIELKKRVPDGFMVLKGTVSTLCLTCAGKHVVNSGAVLLYFSHSDTRHNRTMPVTRAALLTVPEVLH